MQLKKLAALVLTVVFLTGAAQIALADFQTGKIKDMDLSNRSLSIVTSDGQEMSFRLSDEAIQSLERFNTGEEVTINYSGDMASGVYEIPAYPW